MQTNAIENFILWASEKFPGLIVPRFEAKSRREEYDDHVVFVFPLVDKLTMQELIDIIEHASGTVILYRHYQSLDTDYGHSLCAFVEPGHGYMMQLNAFTDARGYVTEIDVTLHTSLERYTTELRMELERINDVPGNFFYKITEEELISFML